MLENTYIERLNEDRSKIKTVIYQCLELAISEGWGQYVTATDLIHIEQKVIDEYTNKFTECYITDPSDDPMKVFEGYVSYFLHQDIQRIFKDLTAQHKLIYKQQLINQIQKAKRGVIYEHYGI